MAGPQVHFDRGPLPGGTAFRDPIAVIDAARPQDVPAAFAAFEDAVAEGHWLAGYATYELGYALCPKIAHLLPEGRELPLMRFGVFEGPEPAAAPDAEASATMTRPEPLWDAARYDAAFRVVHDYIAAGDIYQANLTLPLTARATGTAAALHARLHDRQPVPHGCLVDLGGPVIVSRSPELFFSLDAEGLLTTRPMKGTAPRGATPEEDDALRDALRASEKNRAENLMIVDLLRNDMSRVSLVGSVTVPELFTVERYETLHQMTSRITSQIMPRTTISDLFTALFPCGSITGAPKIRAMEIIAELECRPRGVYCGAVGWIAPDRAMEFNVAIRTLTCHAGGRVDMAVGGGVVWDSTAEDEYAEALLKSRFARLD